MPVLLFILVIASSVFTSIFYKAGSSATSSNRSAPALLCTVYMLFATLYFLAAIFITGDTLAASAATVLPAAMCGTSLALAAYFYLISLETGPFTTSVVLLNFSSIMTVFYSMIFFNETMDIVQCICLAIMCICIYVLTVSKDVSKKAVKKANLKWIVFIFLSFVTNSLIQFGIRMQTIKTGNTEKLQMFFYYFLFAFLTGAVIFLVTGGARYVRWKRPVSAEDASEDKPDDKNIYLLSLLPAAFGLSVMLSLNALGSSYLSKMIPSAVQYPVTSGLSLIISTVVGRIFYKEKLKPAAYAAIGVGIAVVAILNI